MIIFHLNLKWSKTRQNLVNPFYKMQSFTWSFESFPTLLSRFFMLQQPHKIRKSKFLRTRATKNVSIFLSNTFFWRDRKVKFAQTFFYIFLWSFYLNYGERLEAAKENRAVLEIAQAFFITLLNCNWAKIKRFSHWSIQFMHRIGEMSTVF